MNAVRGCEFPLDLFYNVENNVWVRQETGGLFVVGMTAYGLSLSGQIVSFTPKRSGKQVQQNKSCATVESGKWVGPVKAPVSGEIAAVNQQALQQPSLINDDPYGEGWLVKIKAQDWDNESRILLTGNAAMDVFESKMDAEGFGGC